MPVLNETLSNLGGIYMQLKDYEQALVYFSKAREKYENDDI